MAKGLQYRRTDKAIVDAFIKLCRKNDFDRITIQDILDEALVSRNTFYAHYSDKYEIANKLFRQFTDDFNAMLTEYIEDDKMILADMSDEKRNAFFMQKIREFSINNADLLAALRNIHTAEIDISRAFVDLFKERYNQSSINQSHGKWCALEAQIYAYIEVALCDYYADDLFAATISPEGNEESIFYASMYALGICNPEYVKGMHDAWQEYKKKERSNPEVFH